MGVPSLFSSLRACALSARNRHQRPPPPWPVTLPQYNTHTHPHTYVRGCHTPCSRSLSLFFLPSFVRAEWVPRASFLGFSGNSQTPFRCNFSSRHAHSLYRFSLSLSFPFSIPFFFSFGLSFDFQAHSFPYRESERKREHISYLSSCSCLPPFWCLRGRAAPAVKSALLSLSQRFFTGMSSPVRGS